MLLLRLRHRAPVAQVTLTLTLTLTSFLSVFSDSDSSSPFLGRLVVPDAASSSFGVEANMARPPKRPSRGGAGVGGLSQSQSQSRSSSESVGLATQGAGADQRRPLIDGEDLAPNSDNEREMENENDDDLCEDAAVLFGVDLGDGSDGINGNQPIKLDGEDDDDAGPTNTGGTSTTSGSGKKTSVVWTYFHEVKDATNKIRIAAICKHCRSKYTARSGNGTGHLRRHMRSCMKKQNHAKMT